MNTYSHFISLVVVTCALMLSWPSSHAAKWYSGFSETANSLKVEDALSNMSLRQKVGQLFIFGFSGKSSTAELTRTIKELKPGAVIVFRRNIKSINQVAQLNYAAQKASFASSGVPLLIALDQEGGDVTRIQFNPPLPSALAIGMAGDTSISERMGYLVGSLIKAVGFNMNLAPVLDVSDPEAKSFIGTRSFGKDPYHVGSIAAAYAQGLEMANVLATAKHFPGHGGVLTDSHYDLPSKKITLSQLLSSDLLPYNAFAKSIDVSAVMIAHIAFPLIDQSRLPATFSKVIVGDLLRKQMKYKGLIVTDDIEMAAAGGVGSFEQRAVRAVQAGADMVMVAWSRKAQKKAIQAIVKAVKSGKIKVSTIDDTVRRILITKSRVSSLNQPETPDISQFQTLVKSKYINELSDAILEKNFYYSVNRLKEDSFIWSDRPVYVFSTKKAFFEEFQKNTKLSASWIRYQKKNTSSYNSTLNRASKSFGVFYITGKNTASIANALDEDVKKRTFIVNASLPGLLRYPKKFSGVINIFSRHPKAGALVAENILRKRKQVPTRPNRRLAGEDH